MKKGLLLILLSAFPFLVSAQALFVPNGINGVGTSSPGTNVIVGTTNGSTNLDVRGDITLPYGRKILAGFDGYTTLINTGWDEPNKQDFVQFFVAGKNPGNASPKLVLKSNGNVGIGTTNPKSRLEVKGDFRFAYGGKILAGVEGYTTLINTGWDGGQDFVHFYVAGRNSGNASPKLTLKSDGNVGIGGPLTVKGNVHAREIKVTATAGGADFVFADDYALPALQQVESFIKEKKHLPEIPSAAEMEQNGLHLAEMNIKLLQKVEELTLYVIEQEKQIESLKKKGTEMEVLKAEMNALKELVNQIATKN